MINTLSKTSLCLSKRSWALSSRTLSSMACRNSLSTPPFRFKGSPNCNYIPTLQRPFKTLEDVCGRLSKLEEPFHIPPLENVIVPKDYDEYHSIVYSPPAGKIVDANNLVVSIFLAKQSTASVSIVPIIAKLASEFPKNRCLIIDADLVPRAAYDADLQQFPAVLLSFGGDLYRRLIHSTGGYPLDWNAQPRWCVSDTEAESSAAACTLPHSFYETTKSAIERFYNKYNGRKITNIKSKSGTHSYTHGIDTDNLNVKRVGWPTE